MEISEAFGFLKIIGESIKLLPRNGRFMASITFLSLLLPSTLLLVFIYFYRFLRDYMTNSIIISIILLALVEISFLITYMIISHISGIATVLVSAMSYSDKKVSSQDLISRIKATWRNKLTNNFRFRSKNPISWSVAGFVCVICLAIIYPNPITIAIAIVLGIVLFVFQLYHSVAPALSHVVTIVEDVSEGALEKAEQLVEGQRLHGFMFNLFLNLLFLIVWGVSWIGLDDLGSWTAVSYGLIVLNSVSVAKIFVCVAYTVFYFQCKKHHGEDIDGVLANFEYTKLVNDIP